MIDVHFIEFYISRKYGIKLEDYFKVAKSVSSGWRHGKFPVKRIHEFCFREGSSDILELFKKIY